MNRPQKSAARTAQAVAQFFRNKGYTAQVVDLAGQPIDRQSTRMPKAVHSTVRKKPKSKWWA